MLDCLVIVLSHQRGVAVLESVSDYLIRVLDLLILGLDLRVLLRHLGGFRFVGCTLAAGLCRPAAVGCGNSLVARQFPAITGTDSKIYGNITTSLHAALSHWPGAWSANGDDVCTDVRETGKDPFALLIGLRVKITPYIGSIYIDDCIGDRCSISISTH